MIIVTKEKSKSKIVSEEVAYLPDFLVYQSNISYTVIIVAINSQGSSEPTFRVIGMLSSVYLIEGLSRHITVCYVENG